MCLGPVLCNKRSHHNEKPEHCNEEPGQPKKLKKKKKTLGLWLKHRSWGEGKLEAPWGREQGLRDGGPGGMGDLSWRRVGKGGVRSQIYTPNAHSGCSAEKN